MIELLQKREKMNKCTRRLGLDIGVTSIGFSLIDVFQEDNKTTFKNIATNSIIFDKVLLADERRKGRSSRRLHDRTKRRKKNIRNIFYQYKIADKNFVESPTKYLNDLQKEKKLDDVYKLRKKALEQDITKEEFLKSVYSITTKRGYSNQFEIVESNKGGNKTEKEEQEKVNGSINKNIKEIREKGYILPSQLLTARKEEWEKEGFINIPIRNKQQDYSNSLNRNLHEQELEAVVLSQRDNKNIFSSRNDCEEFLNKIKKVVFFQRPLKSFENMVAFCSFYDKYHENRQKRMPKASIYNIELVIRQTLFNQTAVDKKTGEVYSLNQKETDEIAEKWIKAPTSDLIKFKNIFSKTSIKHLELLNRGSSDTILDIKGFRQLSDIFKKYKLDYINEKRDLYEQLCLILSYYKNSSSRKEHIEKTITFDFEEKEFFIKEVITITSIDGFARFSQKFSQEILENMQKGSTFSEALEELNYFDKYLNMPTYNYLPPLNPTKADIKWLHDNIPYFDEKHLFYSPNTSKTVVRIVSVLRKLVNDIIKKYGKIDEIILEGSKELNTKQEEKQIKENQKIDFKKNKEAKELLKNNNIEDYTNKKKIKKIKMLIEQNYKCLYSGKTLTIQDALDEEQCEIEHFIPRSHFWNNSQKNTILVLKKYNQNKTNTFPIDYLKQINKWEDFKEHVKNSKMQKNKKEWLTNEDKIIAIINKDTKIFRASFLNDTRTATKIIKNYLEHYLFPKENRYGKNENLHVKVVSAKAINELKHIFGISKLIASKETGKKDRATNYHHGIDALTVALCDNKATFALHNFFKMKENHFKTAAMKEKIKNNIPVTEDKHSIFTFAENLVKKYQNNEMYVCPYRKRKFNKKGFKDGNKKLIIAKNSKGLEQLQDIIKISIMPYDLLQKKEKLTKKDRTDAEVIEYIKTIQEKLNSSKQKLIIKALEKYGNFLIQKRKEQQKFDKILKDLKNKQKNKKDMQDEELNSCIEKANIAYNKVSKEISKSNCYFLTKKGQKQIVKSVRILSDSETHASTILLQDKNRTKMYKLNKESFIAAKSSKKPFVCKVNGKTFSVEIYKSEKQQFVGLNYFRSLANEIPLSFNKKGEITEKEFSFSLARKDIVAVLNNQDKIQYLAVCNGGGNVSGSSNIIKLNGINKDSNILITLQLNDKNIIKRAKIDFYGNFKIL